MNIILPSLETPTEISDAAVIWLANSSAVGLDDTVLLYVPAVMPISARGSPERLLVTILFSVLVIFTCLSDLTAETVAPENTWVFKSDTIVSVASIATVVVAYPNLLIAPDVTSTISKLWFVLVIFIVPVITSAVTPKIAIAFICWTTLACVGLELER